MYIAQGLGLVRVKVRVRVALVPGSPLKREPETEDRVRVGLG